MAWVQDIETRRQLLAVRCVLVLGQYILYTCIVLVINFLRLILPQIFWTKAEKVCNEVGLQDGGVSSLSFFNESFQLFKDLRGYKHLMKQEWTYRQYKELRPGDDAIDVTLHQLHSGEECKLSDVISDDRPCVVSFGSVS